MLLNPLQHPLWILLSTYFVCLLQEKHENEDIQGSLFEEPSHGALFCGWETFKRTLKDNIDSK